MLGTITLGNVTKNDRMNDRLVREVQYTGPTSYPSGGDAIDGTTDLGSGEVWGVYGTISSGSAVLIAWWDYVNQKLKFFVPNTGAEASGNLSTFTGTLLFTCKG